MLNVDLYEKLVGVVSVTVTCTVPDDDPGTTVIVSLPGVPPTKRAVWPGATGSGSKVAD